MADRDGQPAGEPTAAPLSSGSAPALPQLNAALLSSTDAVVGSLTGSSIEKVRYREVVGGFENQIGT